MIRSAGMLVVVGLYAALPSGALAQTIDLNNSPGRIVIDGAAVNGRAGGSLHFGDLTGDFWNKELIVGSPGEADGRGMVRLRLSPYTSPTNTTNEMDVVITGGAAGDRFGAATDAGHVTRHDVVMVNREPVDPTARDLIVGAPGAQQGRGEVYVFAGPFTQSERRTTANAVFRVIGRPNGQLGTEVDSADLNGDGYREIIAYEPGSGCVHAINARNASSNVIDLAVTAAAITVCVGGQNIDVATGDISGDGIFDLAIGSPDAAGERGQVAIILGRRGAFAAARNFAEADALFTGFDPGDAAGTSLWIADIDDDADLTAELIIGAPGGDGPGNNRGNAGELYVVWGTTALPRALTPNLTLFGVAVGHRIGQVVVTGDMSRDGPEDIVSLAPGANSGIGEVYAYFGRHRWAFPSSGQIDLAASADRRVIGDRAAGPIETIRVWEATARGAEDIVAGVPAASTAAGGAAGRLYLAISPELNLSQITFTANAVQCGSASVEIQIANPSVISVPWTFYTETPWLRSSRAGGTTVQSAASGFRLSAITRGLAPGTYSGNATILSRSRDLSMDAVIWVTLTVTAAAPTARAAAVDFNGDGCGDPALFRPSTGGWIIGTGSSGSSGGSLGSATDIPVPGDYDGDRRAELAVFRPATADWLIGGSVVRHGSPGDLAVPADYDGNGTTDIAVFTPATATWSVRGQSPVQWGQRGDVPVPADYDGDGRADLAVYRRGSGTWLIRGGATTQFGGGYSIPVPADYDGNGTDDIAVYDRTTGSWDVRGQFGLRLGSEGELPAPLDFDRDGRADLALFQRSTGAWRIHSNVTGVSTPMQGGAPGDRPVFLRPFLVFGTTTDFTGDGWTDLVWQHADGRIAVWQMNATTLTGGIVLADRVSDSRWRIGGTADFNRDGQTDLLWQHADGSVVIWVMQGTRLQQGLFVTKASDTRWQVGGTGDINGDGHVDIIWHHPDGWAVAWLMNGTTLTRAVSLSDQPITGDWVLAGVGDANGDGHLDLFWHHRTAGHVVVWIMNGTTLVAGRLSPGNVSDPNWRIVGAADMNGDGYPDLTWQHTNGYAVAWLMQNEQLVRGAALMPSMPSDNLWRLQGPR